MQRLKKFLRFFLGFPLSFLAFLFIGKIFLDNKTTIITSFENLNWISFSLGLLFFLVFFLIKSIVWIMILKNRGFSTEVRTTLYNYSLAEIKRYIPGSIFALIGRMKIHEDSISKKEILKGVGIEAVLLALSAGIVSLPALLYLSQRYAHEVSPFVLISHFIVIAFIIFFITRRFNIPFLAYYQHLLLFIAAWVFYALGCFFVAISISSLPMEYFPQLISFMVLSWLCGYLLFITPMGLGVRELTFTFFLSPFIPIGAATVIAVLTRVGMVLGELLYLCLLYVVKKTDTFSKLGKHDIALIIVTILCIGYFLLFSTLSILKHNNFLSGRFDLGNMTQTVWNTSHGNIFTLTNPDGINQISRLGVHSDFILMFFAPLYVVLPSPLVLLITQSLSIAVGGIFVYLLSMYILKNRKISIILSLSYLLNFWIHNQNMFDFHAVSLATSALLATFYFLLKKRYFLFVICLVVATLTKENVFLVSFLFGLFLFIQGKKWWGGLLSIVSLGIFFFLTSYAIPQARGTDHFALSYYSYLGDSPMEMIKNFFIKPHLILSRIFSADSFMYIYKLFLPTGFIALLSPITLIFAAPDFLIYMLSSNANLRMHYYHYGALIVPFIYVSTMYGILFLKKQVPYKNLLPLISYYILTTSLISAYLYSPLPAMKNADYRIYKDKNTTTISNYLSKIPLDASVSASNNIGAHLSHRDQIYVIPQGMGLAEYIILHGESDSTIQKVDMVLYDEYIKDKSMNFYIFKKKLKSACLCQP